MARVVSAAGERMETVTLTEFLLARIADDEAMAREAIALRPASVATSVRGVWLGSRYHMTVEPAHVLAVCEAHRRIVEKCQYAASPEFESDYDLTPRYDLADDTLRALAAIYADRDGFREEWA